MSFTFHGQGANGRLVQWSQEAQQDYATEESKGDLDFVRDIAERICARYGGNVTVSGSGHANPVTLMEDQYAVRHTDGKWGTDNITINISTQPYTTPPLPDPSAADAPSVPLG